MRRICCFCEKWESGGIESFLTTVLLHLDHSAIEVDIAANCIEESVFTQRLKSIGVRFIQLSGKLRSAKNSKMFRALLRERQYDVVHFNLFQGLSLYYVQIAKQEGVPVRIAHSHNSALRKSKGRALKMLLHKTGSLLFTGAATELWACSRIAAEFLFSKRQLAKKGYQFIPNGIDIERFRFNQDACDEVRKELGLTDEFVIGNVGRLCDQKNQDFLLDVFAEALKSRPNSRLLLVGEGELEEALRSKAERLNVAEKVIFYGTTDRVERLYWAMDVFAFPSLFEGLGIVAVEAQAAGLPVLCSEFVPKEAYVSEHIELCELSKGSSAWSDEIQKAVARERSTMTVDRTFDIAEVTALIQQMYKGGM